MKLMKKKLAKEMANRLWEDGRLVFVSKHIPDDFKEYLKRLRKQAHRP